MYLLRRVNAFTSHRLGIPERVLGLTFRSVSITLPAFLS